jgi:hypothetical protein
MRWHQRPCLSSSPRALDSRSEDGAFADIHDVAQGPSRHPGRCLIHEFATHGDTSTRTAETRWALGLPRVVFSSIRHLPGPTQGFGSTSEALLSTIARPFSHERPSFVAAHAAHCRGLGVRYSSSLARSLPPRLCFFSFTVFDLDQYVRKGPARDVVRAISEPPGLPALRRDRWYDSCAKIMPEIVHPCFQKLFVLSSKPGLHRS